MCGVAMALVVIAASAGTACSPGPTAKVAEFDAAYDDAVAALDEHASANREYVAAWQNYHAVREETARTSWESADIVDPVARETVLAGTRYRRAAARRRHAIAEAEALAAMARAEAAVARLRVAQARLSP